ncbi:MAG: hypothetical protein E4H23_12995 [Chrysiogenales bacterium]|nr:MAG: hypothetical protein E4H23_12995 [Chrysiogenales bacterium]
MKRTMLLLFLIALGGMVYGQELTVTSPHGGEVWAPGTRHNITWSFSGYPANTRVQLLLIHNGVTLGLITDNYAIGSNGSGKYENWPAGSTGGFNGIPANMAQMGNGYKVRIRDMNNGFPIAQSLQGFTIAVAPQMIAMKAEYAPPAIHSSGTVTIHKNMVCDLDSGHESSAPGCDDFWWKQNSHAPYQRLFIPCTGTFFKKLGVWAKSTWAVLHSVSFPSPQNQIPEADLPLNMVVAYQTNYGRRGVLRVTAKGADSSLTIAWVTYQK